MQSTASNEFLVAAQTIDLVSDGRRALSLDLVQARISTMPPGDRSIDLTGESNQFEEKGGIALVQSIDTQCSSVS